MAGAYCVNRRLRMPLSIISRLVEFVGPAFDNIALVLGERHFAMSKLCQSIEILQMFLFFCFFSNAADNHRTPRPMIFLDFPCAICASQARTFLPGTWKDCPCHQDSWDVWQAIDPNLGVGLTCYNRNDIRGDVHDVTIS